MTSQPPRILAGRYEVRELIGRGGMAEIHLGFDNRLSRIIAIKLLRADIAGDRTFQARFRREAKSAAALNITRRSSPSTTRVRRSSPSPTAPPGPCPTLSWSMSRGTRCASSWAMARPC